MFYKFGYCKFKQSCNKDHVKEECRSGIYCEQIKTCALRHPKMCKRIILEGLCQFGEKCAYSHYRRPNLQGEGNENVQEEVNSLKAEVNTLKNTLKMLISIREESEHMQSYIRDIKVEIHILTTNNRELNEKLNNLQKDIFREKDSNCDLEFLKQVSESPIKNNSEQFKCDKCNYTGKTSVSLKKHKNTKHLHEDVDCSNKEESESVSDCINDLFQMEYVES